MQRERRALEDIPANSPDCLHTFTNEAIALGFPLSVCTHVAMIRSPPALQTLIRASLGNHMCLIGGPLKHLVHHSRIEGFKGGPY